jgi:bifunctional oligoribonuclease and PAP phosphatase NrnA
MEKEYKKLLEIIENSKNILITSHKSPDDDATGSVLALFNILNENLKKKIVVNFEDSVQEKHSFLKGFEEIKNEKHIEIIEKENIDLIIVLDGNNWKRFVKEDWEDFKSFVENDDKIKTLCIDHHPKQGFDKFNLYIQKDLGSTAEIIYEIFIEDLKFKITKEIAYCIMTGILGDTGRFLYAKDLVKTFDIAKKLVAFDEQMIEKITDSLERYKIQTLKFLQEIINNTVIRNGYNFSFFSDKSAQIVKKDPTLIPLYKNASELYVNEYVRKVEDNLWGFTITSVPEEDNRYKVSFRATSGTVDTSFFARKFPGGGGHKGASGCDFEAENIEKAIEIMEKVIEKHLKEATL